MRNKRKIASPGERGYTLISMALWAIVLFGFLGLAVDVGHLLINKNEAQTYVDAAAIAASLKMDGTSAGVTAANTAVTNSLNTYDFGRQSFTGTTVEFATTASPQTWVANPNPATDYTRTRVTTSFSQRLYFIPGISLSSNQTVMAQAVTEQTLLTTVKQGAFPFAPLAFNATGPHFGLVPGTEYTMRYPSSKNADACIGDQVDPNHAKDGGNRGFWGDNSAHILRQRVTDDYQSSSDVVVVGQVLNDVGGAKTTVATSLNERAGQDTDATSTSYAAYIASGTGNGRRVVMMPIQDMDTNVVLGIGMFFLLPQGSYDHRGNAAWCAVYIGKAGLPNSPTPGASSTPGAYTIKLVQ